MLIGWDCARRCDEVVDGFVGGPAYAHDELFGRTEVWKPRLDHDLASLAYTAVRLSHACFPWSGFGDGNAVSDEVRKSRFNITSDTLKSLLREWDVSSHDKKALLRAIAYRGSKTRKRKAR